MRSDATGDSNGKLLGRCNVWIMEDPSQEESLFSKLKPTDLNKLAVWICLDYSSIPNMLDELRQWKALITECLGRLIMELPLNDQDKLRSRLASYIGHVSKYHSAPPSFTQSGASSDENQTIFSPSSFEILPPPEGVLLQNFGVPIYIVVCKADLVASYETDAIKSPLNPISLAYLRREALPLGASLAYLTALKERVQLEGAAGSAAGVTLRAAEGDAMATCLRLYRHLVHMLYQVSFSGGAAAHLPLLCDLERSIFVSKGRDDAVSVHDFAAPICGGTDKPFSAFIPPQMYANNSRISPFTASNAPPPLKALNDFLKSCHDSLASGIPIAKPPPRAPNSSIAPPKMQASAQQQQQQPNIQQAQLPQPHTASLATLAAPTTLPHAVSEPAPVANTTFLQSPPAQSPSNSGGLLSTAAASAAGDVSDKRSFFRSIISRGPAPTTPRGGTPPVAGGQS